VYGYTRQAFYQYWWRLEYRQRVERWIVKLIGAIRQWLPQSGGNNLWCLIQRFLRMFRLPPIGRDRLARILRENGLNVSRRRSRRVQTTYSGHHYAVQPNLVKGLKITAPGQVLVADVTYLYIADKHAYLFLVTDAYSQLIAGYHLSDSLANEAAIKALKNALEQIPDPKGVIHHTDRGVQYCCHDFLDELRKYQMRSSMTDGDHAAQNALAESINGLLKGEFLLDCQFPNFVQLQRAVDQAVFAYNHLRIHGSLAGRTPAEVYYESDGTFDLWAKEILMFQMPQFPLPGV